MVSWVFTETIAALLGESECIVYPLVLVVASQQMNLIWVADLQCHKQAYGFKRVVTSVDEITQEQVIIRFNIARLIWSTPEIEEAHKVLVLTMDVTEDFHRGVYSEHHGL